MSVESVLHQLIDHVLGHEPGSEAKRLELHAEVDTKTKESDAQE